MGDLPIGEQPMPDYRISQAKLLRLALLASGGDTPKFDEVFGIIREAQPILDNDTLVSQQLADAVRPTGALTSDKAALPEAKPLGFLQRNPTPLAPVTGIEDNASGTADLAPAKPE